MNKLKHIEKIVKQAAKNNRIAQRELFNLFHGEMITLCIRMAGSRHVAEDIVQDCFIKAFSKLRQLKNPERFGFWLKRIVVNDCLKYLKNDIQYETLELHPNIEEEENNSWYQSISFEEINEEINRLPNGCRQVFTLYLIEDYKHKEIADLLNISVSTAKSQYQYAIRILKNKLKLKMA